MKTVAHPELFGRSTIVIFGVFEFKLEFSSLVTPTDVNTHILLD